MRGLKIAVNRQFVGRVREINKLKEIDQNSDAQAIFIYGRRRVGKTELIEQFFRKKNIIKFEGLQVDPSVRFDFLKDQQRQISESLRRLAIYTNDSKIPRSVDTWSHFFELLRIHIRESDVLYFEEVQWLSSYRSEFFSRLKVFWDDFFKHIPKLRIIICGSSPSFISNEIASNQAFYNRSSSEINLSPFNITEIKQYLGAGFGAREILMATLTVGGICGYLEHFKKSESSIFQTLCKLSAVKDGALKTEFKKIFINSMSSNKHYKNIINYLSKKKFASKIQIADHLRLKTPGGNLTKILQDLDECNFIDAYTPILNENARNIKRYCISDEYLNFYNRFILPELRNINSNMYDDSPMMFIDEQKLQISMGFIFEKWCRKNHKLLAEIMMFNQVKYNAGAFFSKKTDQIDRGFQIDLMYIRKDSRIVICEIKNYHETLDDQQIIKSIKDKRDLFIKQNPKFKHYTYELTLIAPEGVSEKIRTDGVIKHVITFDDIFNHT
ncbi:MAG: AAA family ATPase [Bacteriovoracaceae bacterium]|nr:AAA family ATPase [Bacteriovoracaceae bacterium]